MKKFITYIIATFIFITSVNAQEGVVSPYFSIDKLNEGMYSTTNKDVIMGLGMVVKSDENTKFILAFEGDIYNKQTNTMGVNPLQKVGLYLNNGSLSYKFTHRF